MERSIAVMVYVLSAIEQAMAQTSGHVLVLGGALLALAAVARTVKKFRESATLK